MSYYNLLESRIARLESLVYNEANKSISDTIENARQAASFLKSLGFIKGKRFSGTKSSYYYIGNEAKENTDVIVKVGNKWRVKGRKVKYWNAEYDTKADAEDALKAYWANKHECLKHRHRRLKLEGFSNDEGKELLRNVQHFLIKIFGHTLYFDHYTDKAVDLYYRGDLVAELFFKEATKDQNEEIVIMPANPDFAPVSKEVSEYELQDYLSDLILGDV